MLRGKFGKWLTPARAVALTVALLGAGLLVAGSMASWGSRGTEAVAATAPQATETATADKPHKPSGADLQTHDAAPAEATHTAHDGEAAKTAKPPMRTSEPEPAMGLRLSPRPDIERPARRLALAPNETAAATVPPAPRHQAAAPARHDEVGSDAAWQRFAAHAPAVDGPMIAIVIDDSGHDPARTKRTAAFRDGILTLAFLPYVERLADQTALVRDAGHEILLHLPLEPLNPELDTGPNALAINMDDSTFAEQLAWNLSRLDGYVGINNHMGSRFTADRPAMRRLMRDLAERGLLFLDSRTTTLTVGEPTAAEAGVPFLRRDVFLDNDNDAASVAAQLQETEAVARRQGYAIAIGHPHTWTLDALEAWAPEARKRGFTLVPLTAVLKYRQQAVAQRASNQH
jgi:polysaccharide deacetylase 2 family uncharacterized protein YibQ